MTEFEMAEAICPDNPCLGLMFVAEMTSERYTAFSRLMEVAHELALWEAGLGPKPEGVIICTRPPSWANKDRRHD